jgi:REP element-mobilizing transposase RayT
LRAANFGSLMLDNSRSGSANLGAGHAILRFFVSRGRAHSMARKPRVEVEGGLYHIITRGNNRQRIFGDDDDYQKMLKLVAETKTKLPFYLYLMPNHVHLLVERRQEAISRVMHRLLTGYSRYYNRRYRRVAHLFQKALQGDTLSDRSVPGRAGSLHSLEPGASEDG